MQYFTKPSVKNPPLEMRHKFIKHSLLWLNRHHCRLRVSDNIPAPWSMSKHMSEQEVDAYAEWRGILGDAAQKRFLPQIHHFDGAREAIQ